MNAQDEIIKKELEKLDEELSPKSIYLDGKKKAFVYQIFLVPIRVLAVLGALYFGTKVLDLLFNILLSKIESPDLEISFYISAVFAIVLLVLNEYQKGESIKQKVRLGLMIREGKDIAEWTKHAVRNKEEHVRAIKSYWTTVTISILCTVGGILLFVYETTPKPEIKSLTYYDSNEKEELAKIEKSIEDNKGQTWSSGIIVQENRIAINKLIDEKKDIRAKYKELRAGIPIENLQILSSNYEDKYKWMVLSFILFLLLELGIIHMIGDIFRWKILSLIELKKDNVFTSSSSSASQSQPIVSSPTINNSAPTPLISASTSNSNIPVATTRPAGFGRQEEINNLNPINNINTAAVPVAPTTPPPTPKTKNSVLEHKKKLIASAIVKRGVHEMVNIDKAIKSMNAYNSKLKKKRGGATNEGRLKYWGIIRDVLNEDKGSHMNIPVFVAEDWKDLPYEYFIE